MAIPRVLLIAPRAGLAVADAVRRGAVENARGAVAALADSVRDRRELAPPDEDAPGTLTKLSGEQCLELLATRRVGRLAYVARADVPDVVPVNYAVHDGDLLIRTGPGPKLQAAERRAVVALEADDLDDDAHTGWSVVAVGRAQRLTPDEQRALPDGVLPQAWATGPRYAVVRIRPRRLEGRRLS